MPLGKEENKESSWMDTRVQQVKQEYPNADLQLPCGHDPVTMASSLSPEMEQRRIKGKSNSTDNKSQFDKSLEKKVKLEKISPRTEYVPARKVVSSDKILENLREWAEHLGVVVTPEMCANDIRRLNKNRLNELLENEEAHRKKLMEEFDKERERRKTQKNLMDKDFDSQVPEPKSELSNRKCNELDEKQDEMKKSQNNVTIQHPATSSNNNQKSSQTNDKRQEKEQQISRKRKAEEDLTDEHSSNRKKPRAFDEIIKLYDSNRDNLQIQYALLDEFRIDLSFAQKYAKNLDEYQQHQLQYVEEQLEIIAEEMMDYFNFSAYNKRLVDLAVLTVSPSTFSSRVRAFATWTIALHSAYEMRGFHKPSTFRFPDVVILRKTMEDEIEFRGNRSEVESYDQVRKEFSGRNNECDGTSRTSTITVPSVLC